MLGDKKTKKQLNGKLNIGELLRDIRKQKNLTLHEVANKTGFSEETIRRLELDQFEPKLSTLEMLSDFYKVDLIELIARKRNFISLFSEEHISAFNKLINTFDVDALKLYADSSIQELNKSPGTGSATLIQFMYALKNLKMNPQNTLADTIANLESILLSLSPKYYSEDSQDYPIAIEVSCMLYLSYVYRQSGAFEKAIALLSATIKRIKGLPTINDRFTDFLAAAYLNLAYVYHSGSQHQKVIETVDACLSDTKTSYTKISIAQLLFRKGVALIELDHPQASSYLNVALSLMSNSEQARLKNHLEVLYGSKAGIHML